MLFYQILKSHIMTITIKPRSHTSLLDNKDRIADIAFIEQRFFLFKVVDMPNSDKIRKL